MIFASGIRGLGWLGFSPRAKDLTDMPDKGRICVAMSTLKTFREP